MGTPLPVVRRGGGHAAVLLRLAAGGGGAGAAQLHPSTGALLLVGDQQGDALIFMTNSGVLAQVKRRGMLREVANRLHLVPVPASLPPPAPPLPAALVARHQVARDMRGLGGAGRRRARGGGPPERRAACVGCRPQRWWVLGSRRPPGAACLNMAAPMAWPWLLPWPGHGCSHGHGAVVREAHRHDYHAVRALSSLKGMVPSENPPLRTVVAHHAAHRADVTALACLEEQNLLASGSVDTNIKLWGLAGGKRGGSSGTAPLQLLQVLKGHTHPITQLRLTPDGELLISGDAGGGLRVWRISGGTEARLQHDLSGQHTAAVTGIACHPEERLFATSSLDRTLRVWDMDAQAGRFGALTGGEHRLRGRRLMGAAQASCRCCPGEQACPLPTQPLSTALLPTSHLPRPCPPAPHPPRSCIGTHGPEGRKEVHALAFSTSGNALLAAYPDCLRTFTPDPLRLEDTAELPWKQVEVGGRGGRQQLGRSQSSRLLDAAAPSSRAAQSPAMEGKASAAAWFSTPFLPPLHPPQQVTSIQYADGKVIGVALARGDAGLYALDVTRMRPFAPGAAATATLPGGRSSAASSTAGGSGTTSAAPSAEPSWAAVSEEERSVGGRLRFSDKYAVAVASAPDASTPSGAPASWTAPIEQPAAPGSQAAVQVALAAAERRRQGVLGPRVVNSGPAVEVLAPPLRHLHSTSTFTPVPSRPSGVPAGASAAEPLHRTPSGRASPGSGGKSSGRAAHRLSAEENGEAVTPVQLSSKVASGERGQQCAAAPAVGTHHSILDVTSLPGFLATHQRRSGEVCAALEAKRGLWHRVRDALKRSRTGGAVRLLRDAGGELGGHVAGHWESRSRCLLHFHSQF